MMADCYADRSFGMMFRLWKMKMHKGIVGDKASYTMMILAHIKLNNNKEVRQLHQVASLNAFFIAIGNESQSDSL